MYQSALCSGHDDYLRFPGDNGNRRQFFASSQVALRGGASISNGCSRNYRSLDRAWIFRGKQGNALLSLNGAAIYVRIYRSARLLSHDRKISFSRCENSFDRSNSRLSALKGRASQMRKNRKIHRFKHRRCGGVLDAL